MTTLAEQDKQRTEQGKQITQNLSRIKKKYLVMSGKGGVGKSCLSVNLAVGLALRGYHVGLLDVDLHGPSIAKMLGIGSVRYNNEDNLDGAPKSSITFYDGKIVPALHESGVKVISIDCLLDNIEEAVIWRGPKKIGAIRQFLADVDWGDLDYLFIDSPPGTGDEPLTIAQTIPGAQGIIVTTPQDVSLRDVRKSVNFCKTINMQAIGVIENMSLLTCPNCGHEIKLFKTGGGEQMAGQMAVPFLGRIPILPEIVEASDNGIPPITVIEKVRNYLEPILTAIT